MKTLPETFRKGGFNFTQLRRSGDVALFAKRKDDWLMDTYEVVIVQRHNGYRIGGKDVPPGEAMPSSATWGHLGLSYQNQDDAEAKFAALVNAEAKP